MNRASIRRRTDCRLCRSTRLQRILSLGETPLANELVRVEDIGKEQERFPLDVYLCLDCGHVQLLDVVDPERLFRNYLYVSSTSAVFVEHLRGYAETMLHLSGMPPGSSIVEIGSNDGAFLHFFKDRGMRVLGIDPARALASAATRAGIETLAEFFTLPLAQTLRQQGWEASLVAANNVFAHADDLHAIVEGVAHLLKPDGLFVFEVSYLLDVFEHGLFDTIYHEHLSYHSVKPLLGFFEPHGMELIDAVRVESQGGSLRGIAQLKGARRPRQARVEELIALEESCGLYDPRTYQRLFERIQKLRADLVSMLSRLKAQGKRIVGFGAPAKATTLMFHFGIGPDALDYIIDDNPLKQGLYSPGHHIPIRPPSHLYNGSPKPDYLLILAWNFTDSIMNRHRAFHEAGGRFIVPLPTIAIR